MHEASLHGRRRVLLRPFAQGVRPAPTVKLH